MHKLSKLDLDILYELEKDARQPLSQIAKRLNTSQQVVSYRISSLQRRGVIGGFYTVADFAALGYTSYRTMIRFSNINEHRYKEIVSYLKGHPNVLWLVDCGGRWDILVNFMAKNIVHYNEIITKFRNKFPEQIQNYDILTTVSIIDFGRNYFTKKTGEIKKVSYLIKEQRAVKIDEIDKAILKFLSEDARIGSAEIAKRIGITANTVVLRIRKMKKSGFIQGFKPLIHLENTPYSGYKALIKFQNITELKEKQLVNYLRTNSNVVGVIKLVGSWDFEIEFEVETRNQMLQLTRNIRDKFSDIIKEFELTPLFHEYKYNFFPSNHYKN